MTDLQWHDATAPHHPSHVHPHHAAPRTAEQHISRAFQAVLWFMGTPACSALLLGLVLGYALKFFV